MAPRAADLFAESARPWSRRRPTRRALVCECISALPLAVAAAITWLLERAGSSLAVRPHHKVGGGDGLQG
eukprot:3733311-Prymnesium_polylepis.1